MTPPAAEPSTTPEPTVAEPLPEKDGENGIVWPPSDLYSDEPPFETVLHLQQMMLLLNCLNWFWKDRHDYFAAGNISIYYSYGSHRNRKSEDFYGPDFFVALDTQPHPRRSWMVWEENGKYPNVIVELLSDSTAEIDRGLKKQLYAKTFRTPEYFWFDPDSQEFEGFALVRGQYQPIEVTEQGWRWSEQLQLYLGVHNNQLRFFEASGTLVSTSDEAALSAQEQTAAAQEQTAAAQEQAAAAQEQAAAARERAAAAERALTSEQQRSATLVNKLRELGLDPEAF
jgi:Uma2 family endonuclease